ncbi:potassium channel family protein [Mycobacterium sp. M1]|uniref:Potassium channel family protein n=1 Tax=Mycolicibacter acidiphilus TaxID=2835306 RepID=A0ABS5RE55_9MYCO|nr:potassium channel family protein [Mycolicibacter acidiphilus]MBS9532563.1 potassium channel family protein [Mycolicibacter acidiphilus]
MAAIALVFLAAYSIRVLVQPQGWLTHVIDALTVVTWLAFAIDYGARLWLAPNRRRWFVRHLLDLAVVALPLLQPLRVVRLIILVGALQKTIGNAIHGRVTIYTLASAALVIYVASLAELQVERHDPHATINTFGKALFWAITTVTTVGYGFEHPTTPTGRLIAALLMIGGISLVGMVTATVASWIVRRAGAQGSAQPAVTAAHIEELRSEIRALHAHLRAAGAVPTQPEPPGTTG